MEDEKVKCIVTTLKNGIKGIPKYDVAIAGSFALFCYLKYVLRETVNWKPNDCDVYIYTNTRREFRDVVGKFIDYVKEHVATYVTNPFHYNEYTFLQEPIYIRDVWMCSARHRSSVKVAEKCEECFKISLIFVCPYEEISTAICDFDIDVCKVAYYFKDDRYYMNESTREAIQRKTATVTREFIWATRAPDRYEITQFTSTMRRMNKYRRRGFEFTNMPIPKSVQDGEVLMMSGYQADMYLKEM